MLWMTVRPLLAIAIFGVTATLTPADEERESPSIRWMSDYGLAMAAAEREDALMVVYFRNDESPACRRFDEELARSASAESYLAEYCCVRLSVDAEIVSDGRAIRLLDHPAFAELQGSAGLIELDFATATASERGRALRALPLVDVRGLKSRFLDFFGGQRAIEPAPVEPLEWMSDYAEATAKAEREQRMLLIYFEKSDRTGGCADFEPRTLSDAQVRERLGQYVCLRLAHDAKVNRDGTDTVLLRHSSFAEMVGLPGIAIVDFSSPKASWYGQVVSTFPFLHGKAYNPTQMSVILNLPAGKLTQRTLIYAVRTHPDAPKSTSGELDQYLVSEAESHSAYQARIRRQGHHTWETRFHRINRRLSGGLLATEVCAESWPGQNLLEAAIDCVHCWRQSSGHWRSVRAAHPVFGYDIRRGSNGIWYATGIFGRRGR